MNHIPNLVQDLALILILAGITTLLFKYLKQPVVLGYIIAGFLVSPHFPLFPTITDIGDIRIWADIGVIILLFSLGLEFSFKKLIRVGGPASITAFIEISAMLGVGILLGYIFRWPFMDCIFLGGILSIASTTIILRSFDELNVKTKRFAQLVFGILIIEDLIAVVLLVLLSTIAVSREFAGGEMLSSVFKLLFFLALWFIAGIFFIPSFLKRIHKQLNDETLLIVSLGLCLMMVLFASLAGFSPALGAFIMGSILAETNQAERIEKTIKPVKDLFGAIFFVSVGMLINPVILVDYLFPILLITAVFILFKTTHVTLGAVIAGKPLKTAIYAGMSMAQIGEFSFIIATLGVSLKVTSDFLYPIAVAVSAITTFSTPYMIRLAGPLFNRVESLLPARWKKTLTRYSAGAQNINAASDWQRVLRTFMVHLVFFSVIIIGIILLFDNYFQPWTRSHFSNHIVAGLVAAFACFIALSPFLWALVMRKIQPEAVANLWSNKVYRGPLILLRLVRVALGIVYLGFSLLSILPLKLAIPGIVILILLSLYFSRRIHEFYMKLEERFFTNFHTREREHARINRHELAPWDAHIEQCVLPANSPVTGLTLEEMAIREKFGVNIAMIKRGDNYTIPAPSRFEKIYPGDVLFIIGTDEQIDKFKNFIELPGEDNTDLPGTREVILKKITAKEVSALLDKTIRESGIREKTNGLVVGIERKGRRILNPASETIFESEDKIWIVGDALLIDELLSRQ
jgi:monovalent cation:H+ antiporter-2, CPA2 family